MKMESGVNGWMATLVSIEAEGKIEVLVPKKYFKLVVILM